MLMKSIIIIMISALAGLMFIPCICIIQLYAQSIPIGLHYGSGSPEAQFKAADQSLMVMPTAYTMPKGSSSFTDYELVVVQYAYAYTDRAHISAAMVFPVQAEMLKTFTIGIKQNYYRGSPVQSAAIISYNPDSRLFFMGNVVSVGNAKASVHGAIFGGTDFSEAPEDYVLMAGGIVSLSPSMALISEIISTSSTLDEEGNGIITLGVRFKGDKMSWDIGGFRLLKDNPEIFLLPLLKATVRF